MRYTAFRYTQNFKTLSYAGFVTLRTKTHRNTSLSFEKKWLDKQKLNTTEAVHEINAGLQILRSAVLPCSESPLKR